MSAVVRKDPLRPLSHDAARLQHIAVVGKLQVDLAVLLDEQNGDALAIEE